MAKSIADHGYRVLLHDRRGKSEIATEALGSEYEVWGMIYTK
jgi:hypothetical protein